MSSALDSVLSLAPLTAEHLSAVAEIEQASAFVPWPPSLFEQCLKDAYLNHVLLHQQQVQGFSLCSFGAGEAHLQNIVVHQDQQGQGWGRWLLAKTVSALATVDVQRLFLEVRASNQAAMHLYQSYGFENVGLRRDYYQAPIGREDAYVYVLELPKSS
jgi:ribosomal-protein-alanine N-acetyltransferase